MKRNLTQSFSVISNRKRNSLLSEYKYNDTATIYRWSASRNNKIISKSLVYCLKYKNPNKESFSYLEVLLKRRILLKIEGTLTVIVCIVLNFIRSYLSKISRFHCTLERNLTLTTNDVWLHQLSYILAIVRKFIYHSINYVRNHWVRMRIAIVHRTYIQVKVIGRDREREKQSNRHGHI